MYPGLVIIVLHYFHYLYPDEITEHKRPYTSYCVTYTLYYNMYFHEYVIIEYNIIYETCTGKLKENLSMQLHDSTISWNLHAHTRYLHTVCSVNKSARI